MAELSSLAFGVGTLASVFNIAGTITGSVEGVLSRRLELKIKSTEQSLGTLAELLVLTKNISEDDLALAVKTYWSAVAQITLVMNDTSTRNPFLLTLSQQILELSKISSAAQACTVLDAVSEDIEMLSQILTMYVCPFASSEDIVDYHKRLLGWRQTRASSPSLSVA